MGRAIDRISELPDTVRLHILSLLPRKCAVRTGLLSRRWRDLWRYRWSYATTLDLDQEFAKGLPLEESVNHVNNFLHHRGNKKVEIFRLSFSTSTQYRPDIAKWIEYAIVNGVEELYLNFSDLHRFLPRKRDFRLPDCVLHCESLMLLDLRCCDIGAFSAFDKLKFLETLSLKCVNITDSMVSVAIVTCPFLERLDLWQCPELRSIKVCGLELRLKSLVVVDCWNVCEIEIFAPNLHSFQFNGEFPKKFALRAIPSLSDAMVCSVGRESGLCQPNWIKIIQDLSNVEVLTLCDRAVQQIAVSKESAPIVLSNLQELQLVMELLTETSVSDIYDFFRKCQCPNLEKVFIELPTGSRDPALKMFLKVAAEEPLECHFGSLKKIKMNNFKGYKNERELLRFFLEKAVVLDTMVLVSPEEKTPTCWLKSTMMSVNSLHKASATAKIVQLCKSEDNYHLCPIHYCKV